MRRGRRSDYKSLLPLELCFSLAVFVNLWKSTSALGSMSSIAISYGENGPVFCGLSSDGSHLASCYGSNSAIIYGIPAHFPFLGLTAGDGFVCGLLLGSNQPYCWGSSSYIQMGVPQPILKGAQYADISAGDYHLCGLRKPQIDRRGSSNNISLVDCWGYNMTESYAFNGLIGSISAGSGFNCGVFSANKTVFCWGDQTSSGVIRLVPKELRFRKISAGGYHVCGILEGESSRVFCWGRSLDLEQEISVQYSSNPRDGNVDLPPRDSMVSIVGGKFHACGIRASDHSPICWGFTMKPSTPPPVNARLLEIAAGNYFTCGVLAEKSLMPVCWGLGFPTALPIAVAPGLCRLTPCAPDSFEFSPNDSNAPCSLPGSRICLPCSGLCPNEMFETEKCSLRNDRKCGYNCSICSSPECSSNCSNSGSSRKADQNNRLWALQLPVIVAEIVFAVFVVIVVSITAILYVRYKLGNCTCSAGNLGPKKSKLHGMIVNSGNGDVAAIGSDLDEIKIRRARMFTYEELDRATGGFREEAQVGKGSFSCVFKGVLKDGTVVAVKRAILSSSTADNKQKNSKEFRTELDLLSRLNHAHLLNLLGYCEDGGERLLVYEYMAHGSLHQHLHGKDRAVKERLDWVRRVTIAVQAARGIEYLHGYACPPVIHRDIKSSNILIDEEHNARVADFGLSLLGPADSGSPLAELPAGTLGYLDPEYYRLHYLTTKSDVYSFGVLLLEILSGRKAIDMQYEEGNIVEWAVPLIKSGDFSKILDPILKPPNDLEALKRIANVAGKCVRMRGKDRPNMDKVTTALERALAQLMGSPCSDQPILPTEVVLGSSRLHKKSSSNRSGSERTGGVGADVAGEPEDQRNEFRAPSWITFPSVTSSQRRKSSVSDADIEGRGLESKNAAGFVGSGLAEGGGLRCLEEEIGPASPQENLFLQHNF